MAGPWSYDIAPLIHEGSLTVAGISAASSIGNITFGQQNILKTQPITTVASIANMTLQVGDALGPWRYDIAPLIEGVAMSVNGANATSSIDSVTLTQWTVLDAAHGDTTYSDTAVAYGNDYIYRVTDADGTQLTSNVAEFRGIVVNGISAAASIDNVVLGAVPLLNTQGATTAVTIDNISLTQHQTLVTQAIDTAVTLDNLTLSTGALTLAVSDISVPVTADELTLIQAHKLTVADITSATSIDAVTLEYSGSAKLTISNPLVAALLDNVSIKQYQKLISSDMYVNPVINNVQLITRIDGSTPEVLRLWSMDDSVGTIWASNDDLVVEFTVEDGE